MLHVSCAAGGKTHVKGSLLSVKVSDLMAGKHDSLVSLFTPSERTSLSHFSSTKNFLLVHVMDNVLTKVRFWRYDSAKSTWEADGRVWALPDMAELSAWGINADTSDAIWITSSG